MGVPRHVIKCNSINKVQESKVRGSNTNLSALKNQNTEFRAKMYKSKTQTPVVLFHDEPLEKVRLDDSGQLS